MYVMESAPGARTIVNGKRVDYFCGCGYFALQGHPELIKAACEAAQKYGIASTTSRSGYGNNPVLLDVEKKAADFFQVEDTMYFVSGYVGNIILLQGLADQYDIVFTDQESHYAVKDGVAVVDKPAVVFRHLDPEDLKKKLRKHVKPRQRPLLICDGVFAMTGALAPTPEYLEILQQYEQFLLCVDDAHAVGVIGEKGRGTFEYFGLKSDNLYSCGTLSKAMGGHGGIIPGKAEFIETLKRNSSIFYSSSGTPTPSAAATAKALEIVMSSPSMRNRLWDNVAYAKKRFGEIGFDLGDNPVPILCLQSEDSVDFETVQKELWDKDIAVLYVAPGSYTSAPDNGSLRIAINAAHSHEQIDRLVHETGALL
ncbi:MAG: pyridoxal phosphate-dependent aminotransferase family protein [Phycisphaerales bacterium]|nr:MAG: pyridoxal phosphate-dependent aminotransferase family protein [Phycisphaerales bacterium]